MTRGRITNNLLGLIHQQDYLHQRIAEKEGSFETGLRGMRMKLTIVNNSTGGVENGDAKGADPAYWKHLQENSKLVGYRGEVPSRRIPTEATLVR